ncbi:S-adenosyl-L-methionine-dependent methyltransferase [Apiospora arundinis]
MAKSRVPDQGLDGSASIKLSPTILQQQLSQFAMATTTENVIDEALSSIQAAPATLDLLRRLHTLALKEPDYVSTDDTQPVSAALDRFVALEPDKCALVYLLLRASGARYVVEAGTSFGVSTIYLALAARQNALLAGDSQGQGGGKVIATENEPSKADKAKAHWALTGEGLGEWIDLRVGDIRETLKTDLPEQVDFLLLDSKSTTYLPTHQALESEVTWESCRSANREGAVLVWAVLALPALRLVKPKMRIGATVVADNVVVAKERYVDLLAYLEDPTNGFKTSTTPYHGGLLVAVYVGSE